MSYKHGTRSGYDGYKERRGAGGFGDMSSGNGWGAAMSMGGSMGMGGGYGGGGYGGGYGASAGGGYDSRGGYESQGYASGRGGYDSGRDRTRSEPETIPKHSKLFVLGCKNTLTDESVVREMFQDFGDIEKIILKKDRDTGRSKGFSFVKYAKASQAAEAMAAMDRKQVGNESLKVVLAVPEGDKNENAAPPTRIFIMIPRSHEKPEVQEEFEQYGAIEHVSIVKDRNTGEPRGLAYVNFYEFKDAATALEKCSDKYRPQWAESREKMNQKYKEKHAGDFGGGRQGGYSGGGGYSNTGAGVMSMISGGGANNPNNCCRLKVQFSPDMTKEVFYGLFNIVPGLTSCDLVGVTPDGAISSVVYSNPESAAHAMDRISGFEYPPGFPISIIFDGMPMPKYGGRSSGGDAPLPDNIKALVDNIKQAADVLKTSGFGDLAGGIGGASGRKMLGDDVKDVQEVCSATLPPKQEQLPMNTKSVQRLFWVLKDARDSPNPEVMKDVFCRFGDLIEVYCLKGKKCGYARYASEEAAGRAIKCLDGEDLLGSRFRVEIAEEQGSDAKRPRRD